MSSDSISKSDSQKPKNVCLDRRARVTSLNETSYSEDEVILASMAVKLIIKWEREIESKEGNNIM